MSGRIFRTAGFLTTFTFMTMLATGALHAATPAPVEIKVRGYNLTLRKSEAEQILVRISD